MNREQELKVELLKLQKEKLETKANNLRKQIEQIDEKIDRISKFTNDPSSNQEHLTDNQKELRRSGLL